MTVSARRKKLFVSGAILVLAIFILGVLAATNRISWDGPIPPVVSVGNHDFLVEYADTPAERAQGLSGRDAILEDHAMLFRYDASSEQCFWMKDMKFNIDMVWLDSSRKVTAIEQNVAPSTYPKSFCHEGQYVIELHANISETDGIHVGDQATF